MEDIVPGLLDAIQKDFEKSINGNPAIERIVKMVAEGTATYKDANNLAVWSGQLLSTALNNNLTPGLLPDDKMYFNIADRILGPMLEKDHELISSATEAIQKSMNRKLGLDIKPIKPPLNEDRIKGLVNRLATEDSFEKARWLLNEPIVNFSQSIVDDAIKANTDFLSKAGLQSMIIREVVGDACDWCKEIAGSYTYPDIPDDVYRRHERCRCTVVSYYGKTKQDVWSKVITEIK